jgi:hypothetical protein
VKRMMVKAQGEWRRDVGHTHAPSVEMEESTATNNKEM